MALSCNQLKFNQRAMSAGFILTRTLPGIAPQVLDGWLGPRWYALHATHYRSTLDWSAIVSSRLARSQADQRDWPRWLAQAVTSIERDRQTCLIVPRTTTALWLEVATTGRSIRTLTVELADTLNLSGDLQGWYQEWLERFRQAPAQLTDRLCISPPLGQPQAEIASCPIQDRAALALGHCVLALSVRPKGTLDRLLLQRLQDDCFPAASVRVRLPQSRATTSSLWLDRRAIGWYVPRPSCAIKPSEPPLTTCRSRHRHGQHCDGQHREGQHGQGQHRGEPKAANVLVQWNSALRQWGACSDYLVHCVRGESAGRNGDSNRQAVCTALLAGQFQAASPLQVLLKLIASGRLRSSAQMLRGHERMISFSAVSLPELLGRRKFQNHLSRWDWEPYGLLIRRQWLEQYGARPVIYGDDSTYAQLSTADQAYFQPAQRRSARRVHDQWSAEQEWRLRGDLILNEVPRDALLLFVEFQYQAEALASRSCWPVIWLQSAQTRRWPSVSMSRPGISGGTDRN